MSYDIPDEVKYREKIVFGLDFRQLCHAFLFGVLAIFSYDLPLEGEAKLALPSFFCILGGFFVLFNLEEKVLDAYSFCMGVRKADSSDKRAQALIGVRAIENDQMTLADGSLRAVLQVEPINFSLLDEGQKASFVSNYREFLNHLTTPIQILVRTEKSDAEEIFNEAQEKLAGTDKQIASVFNAFFAFERDYLEEKRVRQRKYYVIVTQLPANLIGKLVKPEEARTQLDQRVKIMQEKLASCALNAERLGTAQLIELFSAYSLADEGEQNDEPKAAKPAPMPPWNTLAKCLAALVRKIRKAAMPHLNLAYFNLVIVPVEFAKCEIPILKELFPDDPLASVERISWIRPAKKPSLLIETITPNFDISISHAKVNGIYHRIIKAGGYPRYVEDGWLEQFMATSEPYDVCLHIHPASISTMLAGIHRQLIKQTSDLLSSRHDGTPNPSLEIKHEDTMKVYELLYKGKEKMFNVSLYVDCQAETTEKLDLMTERCKANMNALLIVPKQCDFRMADGIKSMLPIGADALGAHREFLTSSLCATFPFLYPVDSRRRGVFFAHEGSTLNPIFIDFDSMSNKHFFVLGISGSGKSYAAKFLLMQHILARDPKIYILDPNSEYTNLVRRLGGTEIVLSKDSDKIINLFDLAGEDFGSKMLTLISVFDIITGGLTESQKGVLNEALVQVYAEKGIQSNDPTSWNKMAPTFSDLREELWEMKRRIRRAQTPEEKSVGVLLNRVRMYSKGGFFDFLDRQTRVDLDSNMLDFDLSNLPPQVKQLVMFSVLELISREIRKDKKPKVVLIDEGWSLLRSREAENYIMEFIKTSRKFNASIGFITQEIEDLLRSESGRSILNTTSTKILLRQNSSNLELISKILALNARERDYLMRADKGEGLLISEHGRFEFIVKAPEAIHSLITTDPNERALIVPPKKERKKSQMDSERGYYLESELNDDQRAELARLGFVQHSSKLFDAHAIRHYYVKRMPQESPEHSLMSWAIANEIRGCGGKPEVRATKEADVSVRIGEKRICFEVETGDNIHSYGPEHVREKMAAIRRNCDKLIVLVTKRELRGKYANLSGAETITRTEVQEAVRLLFK